MKEITVVLVAEIKLEFGRKPRIFKSFSSKKMPIIETKKINKDFIKSEYNIRQPFKLVKSVKPAVRDLDVSIEAGELVGFLGPNGAGKTTFLKIISGIIHPTSGEAKVLGFVPWERNYKFLRKISLVMGQKNQLWWDLPAIDSFKLLKEVYDIPKKTYERNLETMMGVLDMHNLVRGRLRNMSLGERMKCELTACFLHDPKVIFLDEPTIGLDVTTAQSIRKFIQTINREKKCTIVLTSHYMGDIEALCKRVIMINNGEKIYDGDFTALINKYAPERIIKVTLSSPEEKKIFSKIKYKKEMIEGQGVIRAKKEDIGQLAEQVFDKFDPDKISITEPDAEEVIAKIYRQ